MANEHKRAGSKGDATGASKSVTRQTVTKKKRSVPRKQRKGQHSLKRQRRARTPAVKEDGTEMGAFEVCTLENVDGETTVEKSCHCSTTGQTDPRNWDATVRRNHAEDEGKSNVSAPSHLRQQRQAALSRKQA